MKIGKDCLGNKVVLNDNKLYFYKDNDTLFKTVSYLENKSANKEFVRITSLYRGHNGGGEKRKHNKIYIRSVIISI